MTISPDGAPRVPQPAEVSPTTINALWDEAKALTAGFDDNPIVGRFGTFPAVIDGGPVELVVMVHPTQQAEDGSVGSISVCPEGSDDDSDATHYQFRFAPEGMTLGKLLPVDFSRAGFDEPMPVSQAEYHAWVGRRAAARNAFELAQRAEHERFGLTTIYEPEAGQLIDALRLNRAALESQEPSPGMPKISWISALVRRWFRQ
jgi:hypothetical protein